MEMTRTVMCTNRGVTPNFASIVVGVYSTTNKNQTLALCRIKINQ